MEVLLLAAGISLILTGITDVFITVHHPDGFGFLSSRLYNGLFASMHFLTRPLPPRPRALGLSMAAPLMVPVTITVWIALVLTGYAFVYYAGMGSESFNFSSLGLELSLGEALYVSGTAISTLGFGDVTPADGLYQTLAVSEALIGFGILTVSVSYVVGIYGVVQRLGVLGAGLLHQASDTAEPLSILAPHFPDGEPRDIDPHIMFLHRSLVELYEGLKRYPVLYYYHSRRAYRSLPYTFRMIGGVAGALRWGLPKDHPAGQSPWLPTLITGVDMMTSYIDERFLSESLEEAPEPSPLRPSRPPSSAARNLRTPGWRASSRCSSTCGISPGPRTQRIPRSATSATKNGSPSLTATGPFSRSRPGNSATTCTSWTATPATGYSELAGR